jgi:hypothetical protein
MVPATWVSAANAQFLRLRNAFHNRRNWPFHDTEAGAKASANLYGLIETAKACGLEPYHYLRRIFTDLPKACTVEDFEALLPMNLTSDPTLPRFTPRR